MGDIIIPCIVINLIKTLTDRLIAGVYYNYRQLYVVLGERNKV